MDEQKKGWKELPEGDVLAGATSLAFKTGNWRTARPVHIREKCINCHICWTCCPDTAVIMRDGKFGEFSLVPESQYVHPAKTEKRPTVGALDVGAFELKEAKP